MVIEIQSVLRGFVTVHGELVFTDIVDLQCVGVWVPFPPDTES